MKLKDYNKEMLNELCKNSYSYAEVLRKAGCKYNGGNLNTLKRGIEVFNIDISHFTGQLWSKGKTKEIDDRIARKDKYSIEDIFKSNSDATMKTLKKYIRKYNLVEYVCSNCGCNGEWHGGKISLELHHKDGDKRNNELSNLIYLCPNCHALTDTYRGKNKTGVKNNQVTEEDFVKALELHSNIHQALIYLGLSDRGANYDRAKSLIKKYNIQK